MYRYGWQKGLLVDFLTHFSLLHFPSTTHTWNWIIFHCLSPLDKDSKETKVQPREVQNFIESQVSAPLAEWCCQVGISKLDLHAKLLFRIFCNCHSVSGILSAESLARFALSSWALISSSCKSSWLPGFSSREQELSAGGMHPLGAKMLKCEANCGGPRESQPRR